jgi:hypothetical protein
MKKNIHAVAEEPEAEQESKMNGSPLTSPDWKEEFMACLAVPVFADMRQQEAIALREANKPDSLYRYRPLNKNVLDRELENIERQQVWLTQPIYANDPFDSSFSLVHEAYAPPQKALDATVSQFESAVGDKLDSSELAEFANLPKITKDRFKQLFKKAYPDESEAAAEAVFAAFQSVFQKLKREQVHNLNEFTRQNLSVCCFCERRDEIQMWAYYADQHRGCCIEFDVRSQFIPGAVGLLYPVIYRDEPFDVTPYYSAIAAGGGNNWAAMLAACHKTKRWEHEKEWRIVLPYAMPKGSGNHPIPIKTITMGLLVELDVERRLFDIARRLGVPLYRTLQSYLESSLNFELVTSSR